MSGTEDDEISGSHEIDMAGTPITPEQLAQSWSVFLAELKRLAGLDPVILHERGIAAAEAALADSETVDPPVPQTPPAVVLSDEEKTALATQIGLAMMTGSATWRGWGISPYVSRDLHHVSWHVGTGGTCWDTDELLDWARMVPEKEGDLRGW